MTQETLGYVKLEWTCPKCGSRNPGAEKTCVSCGAPQPQEVQFEQAAGEQVSQDETLKKVAEAGPDIHCPFCGTRNPADAAVCSQCGADFKEGVKREVGRVVGAYQASPVRQAACPNCGQLNPETSLKCARCGAPLTLQAPAVSSTVLSTVNGALYRPSPAGAKPPTNKPAAGMNPWLLGAGIAVLVGICLCAVVAFAYLSAPRESRAGQVETVQWQTSVAIEELGPVERQDWQDEIPTGAQTGACTEKVRSVQDQEPVGANYNKVCGTPYTVDTGSGVGKVVQECQFEVLEPYCAYVVQEWQVVDQATLSGSDLSPQWADPPLGKDQRLGGQEVVYVVVFETDQGQYRYSVNSLDEFRQFQVGSQWVLKINAFNQIVGVEPP